MRADRKEVRPLKTVIAFGISMRPFIKSGAEILQVSVSAEEICLGDIITFSPQSGVSFTHRVVRILKDKNQISFLTKGDSGLNLDAVVHADQVIARVIYVDQTDIRTFRWRFLGRLIALISYGQYCVWRRLPGSKLNRFRHWLERKGLFPKIPATAWFANGASPIGWLNGLDRIRQWVRTRSKKEALRETS